MIIYRDTKRNFDIMVEQQEMPDILYKNILEMMHRRSSKSEQRSWQNSLTFMYMALNDQAIPDDAGIAVEYRIPQTSMRVDFIISGYDENKNNNVIIIELKQWSEIQAIEGNDALVRVPAYHDLVVHPSYQAWSYAALLKDYSVHVQKHLVDLKPCAYLHNYKIQDNDPLFAPQYKIYLDAAPAYTKKDVNKLRQFIKKQIVYGDNGETIYYIDNGKLKPSKSLQDAISSMIKGKTA